MEIKSILGARFGALSINKKTSTNPFENVNFKGKSFAGNVLLADVFQAIKPVEQKPSKMKMVSSAVVSAVNSFKSSITQPIVKFAHSVRETFSSSVEALKATRESIKEMGRNVHDRISSVFHSQQVEESSAPRILSMKHINSKASVQDLRTTWMAENAKISLERALEGEKVAA